MDKNSSGNGTPHYLSVFMWLYVCDFVYVHVWEWDYVTMWVCVREWLFMWIVVKCRLKELRSGIIYIYASFAGCKILCRLMSKRRSQDLKMFLIVSYLSDDNLKPLKLAQCWYHALLYCYNHIKFSTFLI